MSRSQRDKGLRGELEVKHVFADAGYPIRGLDGSGDNFVLAHGFMLHVETKRRETLKMDAWSHQAESEAPPGTIPLVCYRRSREPWRVSMRLSDLLTILSQGAETPSARETPIT